MYQATITPVYIIKVKGKAKIPDYVQLRDDNFVLVGYFRTDRPFKLMKKYGWEGKEETFAKLVKELPFGKIQKITI